MMLQIGFLLYVVIPARHQLLLGSSVVCIPLRQVQFGWTHSLNVPIKGIRPSERLHFSARSRGLRNAYFYSPFSFYMKHEKSIHAELRLFHASLIIGEIEKPLVFHKTNNINTILTNAFHSFLMQLWVALNECQEKRKKIFFLSLLVFANALNQFTTEHLVFLSTLSFPS